MSQSVIIRLGGADLDLNGHLTLDEWTAMPHSLVRRLTLFVTIVAARVPGTIYVTAYADPNRPTSSLHYQPQAEYEVKRKARAIDVAHERSVMRRPEVIEAYRHAKHIVALALPYGRSSAGTPLYAVVYEQRSGTPAKWTAHPSWDWDHLYHAHIQGPPDEG